MRTSIEKINGDHGMYQHTTAIISSVPALALILGIVGVAHHVPPLTGNQKASIVGRFRATAAAPTANGDFRENMVAGPANGLTSIQGTLIVRARQLTPHTKFGVNVGGIPIGTVRTNSSGSGTVMFRTRYGRSGSKHFQELGVDPRGKMITLTNSAGEEVLQGEISDPTTPGGVRCCLDTHDQSGDQQGCDSLLPTECVVAGGIDVGPGSCEPDPCPNTSTSENNTGDAES